jgi:glycosyltransferase involved in cell wall biosynthesis
MRAFDVVALTSHTEGTPIVLLEAMAACVPIVATRVGGVPDLLEDGDAILVADSDPKAVAEAIDLIRFTPGLAEKLVNSAHKRLQTAFGFDQWLANYEDLYERVLRNHA